MAFLISLILAAVFAWFCSGQIKKHSGIFYIISALFVSSVITLQYSGLFLSFPTLVLEYIWPIFANCSFATALFVIVMTTGALKNGSAAIKKLMPIRAELSIIACILTLSHNISYGKTYFVKLFTDPSSLKGAYLPAAIVSVLLVLIMLPLMITSFPVVRKKMNAKKWKKLQRSAYLFYGLIYLHVLILDSSFIASGKTKYIFNLALYTAVFATYAAMRTEKLCSKRSHLSARQFRCSSLWRQC